MDKLYRSSLPGLPKKLKWPVKVVGWQDRPLVFAPPTKAKMLKKKPATLQALHADIEWALAELRDGTCEPSPTQDEGSPTRCEPSPTTDLGSPTRCEPSPTTDLGSPTHCEPSPTTDLGSPTRCEPSPTQDEGSPTRCEPSPTQDTGSPTYLSANDCGNKDIHNPKIYVSNIRSSTFSTSGQKKKDRRIWNQFHACLFCPDTKNCIKTNIAKHLRKKHKNEKEMKDICSAEKNGKKNKIVCAKLDIVRNRGDHKNNMKVVTNGEGEFIIGRSAG